jgi:hypothetical protein
MNTPDMHINPELLSAYLDDEVNADERQLIQAHLPTCAACQRELESLRFMVAMVHALPPRPIPRTFYVTEEMVAPASKTESAGWWGWLRGLAPFGAAVAALLVVLVLSRPYLTGVGGSAAPSAAPQATNAEIAVAPADSAEESMPVEESAAPEGEMQTREGETPTDTVTDVNSATLMEPPAEAPVESVESASTPTSEFTLTAPIVGAGDVAQDDSDAGANTGGETAPVTETTTGEEQANRQITPATMNTTLIVTIILVVVAVGALVIFARQRP